MLKFKRQHKDINMSQRSKQSAATNKNFSEENQSYLNMEPVIKQNSSNDNVTIASSVKDNSNKSDSLANDLKINSDNENIQLEVDDGTKNNNEIVLGCSVDHDFDNAISLNTKPYINVSELESCEIFQAPIMSASEFIKNGNYDIKIEDWFNDIWYFLVEDRDVIITKPILSFMFKNKTDISSSTYDIFKSYREQYKNYLIQCKIPFETLKYSPTITEKHPILKNDLFLSNNPTKKTWIKISFVNFKESIMLLSSADSKETRKMFMMLEQIFYDYNKYALSYHTNQFEINYKNKLSLKEKENRELKSKISIINEIVIQKGNIKREQLFYIATSKIYSMQNIFKIGGVENRGLIKSRFNTYNFEQPKNDSFFYVAIYECHDYQLVEHFISSFLENFRMVNKSNLYKINFDNLNNVVEMVISQLDDYISYFNSMQPKFIDNLLFIRDLKENIEIKNKDKGVWLNASNFKKRNFIPNTN